MPPDGHPSWWYQCIPSMAIVLKKSPDDIILGGRHPKQWSGIVFRTQNNVRSVDLVAMLGGVHLSDDAPLRMMDDPSQPLGSRFELAFPAWKNCITIPLWGVRPKDKRSGRRILYATPRLPDSQ